MEGSGGFKVEKPSESNLHIWKQKGKFLLAFRDLDNVLTDSAPTEGNEVYQECQTRNAKARAIIGLTFKDDHLDHFRGLLSTSSIWSSLVNIFQRGTFINKLRARRKFYSASMLDQKRVLPYINRVLQIVSDLRNMEVTVAGKYIAMGVV